MDEVTIRISALPTPSGTRYSISVGDEVPYYASGTNRLTVVFLRKIMEDPDRHVTIQYGNSIPPLAREGLNRIACLRNGTQYTGPTPTIDDVVE